MSTRASLVSRALTSLVKFRWPVARVVVWIFGTVLFAVQGKWLIAGVFFVLGGAFIWIWAGVLLLIWRRQRRREREGADAARPSAASGRIVATALASA